MPMQALPGGRLGSSLLPAEVEVPGSLEGVKTGVLKTPFTECWKSFPEDENEGCYFSRADKNEGCYFFRADENAANLYKKRVLCFFRIEMLVFPRGQK